MGRDLPKYCTRFGKRDYIYFRYRGLLRRMPDDPTSPDFLKEYECVLDDAKQQETPVYDPIQKNALDALFKNLERGAKGRARRANRAFTLPEYWGADTYTRQNGICAISGLVMRLPERRRDPYGPSIDRINSDIGYTPENSQLTILAVNRAKNDISEKEFKIICRAILKNSAEQSVNEP